VANNKGRRLPLSLHRRLVCDLLEFARQVPSIPVQRTMNLRPLQLARAAAPRSISWTVLFLKAFARVAAEFAPLRQAYMGFPTAGLYEHPFSIGSVTLERDHHGEPAIFMPQFSRPEDRALTELDDQLRAFRSGPIEGFKKFRRMLLIGRLPRLLRRLLWWLALNISGKARAHHLGTFVLSVYSALGAESLHPLTPLTSTVNYGVLGDDGSLTVRIVYDHRVLDGATVARALARLEEVLNNDIVRELRDLSAPERLAG